MNNGKGYEFVYIDADDRSLMRGGLLQASQITNFLILYSLYSYKQYHFIKRIKIHKLFFKYLLNQRLIILDFVKLFFASVT